MAAPPPRKRQRRLVVLSSDEDESRTPISPSQAPPPRQHKPKARLTLAQSADDSVTPAADVNGADTRRLKAKPKNAPSNSSNPPYSPSASPEKRRKKPAANKTSPSKSLHSFFTPATEEQRWNRIREECTPDIVEEIEDEEDAECIFNYPASQSITTQNSSQATRSSRIKGFSGLKASSLNVEKGLKQDGGSKATVRPQPTKRFLIPGDTENVRSRSTMTYEQLRPWTERFAPTNLGELAVHRKKVADVQKWLTDVFTGRSRRVGKLQSLIFLSLRFLFRE